MKELIHKFIHAVIILLSCVSVWMVIGVNLVVHYNITDIRFAGVVGVACALSVYLLFKSFGIK